MIRLAFLDETLTKNIFDASGPRNRDDSCVPWLELQKLLLNNSISVHAYSGCNCDAIIELNFTGLNKHPEKTLLLITEPPCVNPLNFNHGLLSSYKSIMSVFQIHVQMFNASKVYYPAYSHESLLATRYPLGHLDMHSLRKNKIGFVGSNFLSTYPSSNYSRRREIVNRGLSLGMVDVYGKYWDHALPPLIPYQAFVNKSRCLASAAIKLLVPRHLKSIKPVTSKSEILSRYKFSFAFENSNLTGYLTEKIFDSWLSGSFPFYLGSPVDLQGLPGNLYCDLSCLPNSLLFEYMQSFISSFDYSAFLDTVENLFRSGHFYRHSSEYFSSSVHAKVRETLEILGVS